MYEPYKKSKLLPIKVFGGRIFTTTAVQAQKNNLTLSHGPKTPLVACVFHLALICTWFWLNVNRYTCFWHLPIYFCCLRTDDKNIIVVWGRVDTSSKSPTPHNVPIFVTHTGQGVYKHEYKKSIIIHSSRNPTRLLVLVGWCRVVFLGGVVPCARGGEGEPPLSVYGLVHHF